MNAATPFRSFRFRRLAARAIAPAIAAFAASAGAQWTAIRNARLDEARYYDGDSFELFTARSRRVYRLYFVDAPETDESFPDRVREQAEYWRIPPERVLQLGEEARRFAREFLKDGATVHHRREEAGGRGDRTFCYIESDGRGLDEALVEAGLARVFGKGANLPDGTPEEQHWERLRAAERRARAARVGGWADRTRPGGRWPGPAPASPPRSGAGDVRRPGAPTEAPQP